ncbi:hypothetical protein [Escherichia coli]|uniref:hypothetical protein n=1 Tax=Escherichia coli TaxID=562 RepID=UPI00202598AA|nr:hypothetical protein [Escherichia coli]
MLTRKSIDTVLLSVGAEKLSQREWDWMKMLNPMDPSPAMVAASSLVFQFPIRVLRPFSRNRMAIPFL